MCRAACCWSGLPLCVMNPLSTTAAAKNPTAGRQQQHTVQPTQTWHVYNTQNYTGFANEVEPNRAHITGIHTLTHTNVQKNCSAIHKYLYVMWLCGNLTVCAIMHDTASKHYCKLPWVDTSRPLYHPVSRRCPCIRGSFYMSLYSWTTAGSVLIKEVFAIQLVILRRFYSTICILIFMGLHVHDFHGSVAIPTKFCLQKCRHLRYVYVLYWPVIANLKSTKSVKMENLQNINPT